MHGIVYRNKKTLETKVLIWPCRALHRNVLAFLSEDHFRMNEQDLFLEHQSLEDAD